MDEDLRVEVVLGEDEDIQLFFNTRLEWASFTQQDALRLAHIIIRLVRETEED
jgi:hypothetical protein